MKGHRHIFTNFFDVINELIWNLPLIASQVPISVKSHFEVCFDGSLESYFTLYHPDGKGAPENKNTFGTIFLQTTSHPSFEI